jgi:hypothetical protein
MNLEQILIDRTGKKASTKGYISGKATLHSEFGDKKFISGDGEFTIQDSRFISNIVFVTLGELLGTNIFNNIAFTTVNGHFHMRNQKITLEKLVFQNPMIEMKATGTIMTDGTVDAYLYIVFFRSTLGRIPIVRDLATIVGKVGSGFIKFKLTGTLSDPKIVPIPLSIDEINRLLSKDD